MTAGSIAPDSSAAYAQYLDGKASAPSRGDYYLGRDGLPTESPGRWRAPAEVLQRLGVDPAQPVAREALEALMEGRSPGSSPQEPEWIRRASPDGTRAAGIDVTFSAPKSVSIAWSLADADVRAVIEGAHREAVGQALEYLQQTVPVVKQSRGRDQPAVEVPARGLLAAEFVHTTARGVDGGVPDPQLHSHCVITSAVREDGSIAAVRSRPVFRAAREVGAFYRASLAWELREQGFAIETGTGKDGRYFELAGIDDKARAAFSKRAVEVQTAADEFRARTGRAPARGELRAMKLASRQAKTPTTRGELDQAWRATAQEVDVKPERLVRRGRPGPVTASQEDRRVWAQEVDVALTRDRAIFTDRELRAGGLERAAGRLPAQQAAAQTAQLEQDGTVLKLEDGRMTTRRMRGLERDVELAVLRLGDHGAVPVDPRRRKLAARLVHERIGGPMSAEQLQALEVLTGPERACVLIGPAGTGKGVVIDAVARTELLGGREVLGTAVAGATAERLGRDSPALEGRTRNIDALMAAVDQGRVELDDRTTVIVDEAGMGDTDRLNRLAGAVDQAGAKLVLVGDARQLASVGPGGLLDRLTRAAPSVELSEVRRTQDPAEQEAWRQLRAGEPEQALAHYAARRQLHMDDTRDEALERAVGRYDQLAAQHGHQEVALMTDGPNLEIDLMNRRVQQLRLDRGELGEAVPSPTPGPGLYVGDRVAWTAAQRVPDQPRVENGTRGELVEVLGDVGRVQLDGTGRLVDVTLEQQEHLRLAYAQHLYRQQGATVDRAVTLTGGWQTSREGAYVQASRARHGIDWHVSREQLGQDGTDPDRIEQLAARMRVSGAQVPSTQYALAGPEGPEPTSAADVMMRAFDVLRGRAAPDPDVAPELPGRSA